MKINKFSLVKVDLGFILSGKEILAISKIVIDKLNKFKLLAFPKAISSELSSLAANSLLQNGNSQLNAKVIQV